MPQPISIKPGLPAGNPGPPVAISTFPAPGGQRLPAPWSTDQFASLYPDAYLTSVYDVDTGILSTPISQTGLLFPEEIVQLRTPTVRRIVTFQYSRYNEYPQIPDAAPNSNEVLVSQIVQPVAPIRIANDTVLCVVRGTYIYIVLQPGVLNQTGFVAGRLPVEADPILHGVDTAHLDSTQK